MQRWRKNLIRSAAARRFIAGVVLVAYTVASAGFLPLPAFANKAKSDTPFPCQDHPCGCASAEECWTHCCCFSVEQRWEWAASHEVTPPEYAVKPECPGRPSAHLRDAANQSKCTDCNERPACCATRLEGDDHPSAAPQPSAPILPVGVFTAARCQALAGAWLALGVVLPIAPGSCIFWDPAIIDPIPDSHCTPVVLSHVPPDPPPRIS